MSEPKPFASLGPTLLARKGGARPAMRPQLASMSAMGGAQMAEAIAHDLEDLGWNDMGDAPESGPGHDAQVLALSRAPLNPRTEAEARLADAAAHAELGTPAPHVPEVLRQRRAAAEELADDSPAPVAKPALARAADSDAAAAPAPARATARRAASARAAEAGRRAAFTLRLDGRRHLMLRLASTVKNRSAQQLVTAALDQYLAGIPEIEALAAQVKRDRHDR